MEFWELGAGRGGGGGCNFNKMVGKALLSSWLVGNYLKEMRK